MQTINYRSGYKYQLRKPCITLTPITNQPCSVQFMSLDEFGLLTIGVGYAWDGPSGPSIDTKTFMRGSLVHDALYGLMHSGVLASTNKDAADRLLQRICIADGMWSVRAGWVYQAVKRFGSTAVSPTDNKEEHTAP